MQWTHLPPVVEQDEMQQFIQHCLDVGHRLLRYDRVDLVHDEGQDAGQHLALST